MDFTSWTVGDVAVFNIDINSSSGRPPSLYEQSKTYLETGIRKFIFNLGNDEIKAAPDDVGRILECAVAIVTSSGTLKLSGLSMMRLKKLPVSHAFEVFPNIESALDNFNAK